MADERAAKKPRVSAGGEDDQAAEPANPWRHACADVVSFHLLESVTEAGLAEEMKRGGTEVQGEFFHQHFGEEEQISGYKGLKVKIWMSVRTYHVWVEISHTARKQGFDQIVQILSEHFPEGIARSSSEFVSQIVETAEQLSAELAEPKEGTVLQTLDTKAHGKVAIHHFALAKAPQLIQELHARFEPLLLFYIDGASLIEKGDDKWDVLLAVQHREDGCPALLGLTTLYNFWAYPDTCRLRLSQILVMPPYRDAGLGKAMLALSYKLARERHCVDLTLEDPTPNLQRVREKLEVEQLRKCPWVQQQLQACVEAVTSGKEEWPQIPLPSVPRRQVAVSDGGSALMNAAAAAPADPAAAPAAAADDAAAAAAGSAAQQQPQPAGDASASPSSHTNNSAATAAVAAAGRSGAAAARKPPSGPVACLTPSHAFLAAVTHEFKIYNKEARLVWEALLYLQPQLWSHPVGKAALTELVRERLELSAFATVKAEAEKKQVVPLKSLNGSMDIDFIMMRVAPVKETEGTEAGAAGAGSGSAGAAGPSSGAAGAAVAAGRLTLTTMSVEEKEEKMSEMCEERWEQLEQLKTLLAVA